MPDLAFSNTNNVGPSWTVQKLSNIAGTTTNLGYDAKAPVSSPAPADKKDEK
jgi:hypothetical protein